MRVPLRWGDMDAQAHLNNGAYVEYLQEARVHWLLTSRHRELLGSGILVVGHQVEFLRPVRFDARALEIELSVDAVGAARLVLNYRIGHGGVEVARAKTVLASYDLAAARLRRFGEEERAWLREAMAPAEPMRPLAVAVETAGAVRAAVPVRWGDLDPYGHVNNVRFFDYVQEARIEALQTLLGAPTGGPQWVVVRQDLDYRRQLAHRLEPYDAFTSVAAVGSSSVTLGCVIADGVEGPRFAEARTVLVCTDDRGRPRPLPEALRARIAAS